MKINTKATSVVITGEISDYLFKKLEGLSKFLDVNDESIKIDVELGRTTKHHEKGDIFRAEINIFTKQKTFRAEVEAGDLYSAIDILRDRIFNDLSSDKSKTIRLLRKGGQHIKNLLRFGRKS